MSDFDIEDLPDALQERVSRAAPARRDVEKEERNEEILEQLGQLIADKRDKAVSARKESGIEAIWQACEEAYLGIDDTNRSDYAAGKWIKPTSLNAPVTTAKEGEAQGSTAFVLLTSRYVDMAASKISEIALPIDEKAFSFEPEPIPELILAAKDTTPLPPDPVTGQAIMAPPKEPLPGMPPPPPAPGQEPGQPPAPKPMTAGDLAQQALDAAADSIEKAEKRVWDWMQESKYPAEARRLMHDAARIGVGVIKGPFPKSIKTRAMSKGPNGKLKLTVVSKTTLASKWMDVWNLFPDGACGEDIHSGDHVFERDNISRTLLKRLKRDKDSSGKAIYIPGQIDKVLEEGPEKCNVDGGNPNVKVNKDRFTIWYFTGTVKLSDMMVTGAIGVEDLPDDLDEVYAIITIVNDTVIRATMNPLETGSFPYRAFPWTHRAGSWAGRGVGEQVAMPQRMVNAGTRALLNNAGISSGPQILIDPVGLVAADGTNRITPNKIWHRTPDATVDDIRKLFSTVDIPNQGEKLMSIIQYGMKLAEDQSSIPLVSQGKKGNEQAPQTFGEVELQDNNADTLLRGIGQRLDDYVTEPLVTDYYEMLLLDPRVPDEEKGSCRIVANGTMAMVEKAIQEATMLQAGQLTANPAYGINPRKWFAEYWRTKRLDPRKIQFSDEEMIEQAKQPQPEPPVIAAAKIRAQSAEKIAQGRDQTGMAKVQADTDRDTAYVNAETMRYEATKNTEMEELGLRREIANLQYQTKLLEFAQTERISLQEAKTKLADTAMKLGVQKEISGMDRSKDLNKGRKEVIKPPTEPAGLAPDGQSFQA